MFAEIETMPISTMDDFTRGASITVKKTGRTSKTTYGYLCGLLRSTRPPLDSGFVPSLCFKLPYYVKNKHPDFPFFEPGDSGSGVFVVKEKRDFPLGIAFGFSPTEKRTFVCKIDTILNDLDINIVKYRKDKKRTSSN